MPFNFNKLDSSDFGVSCLLGFIAAVVIAGVSLILLPMWWPFMNALLMSIGIFIVSGFLTTATVWTCSAYEPKKKPVAELKKQEQP